MSEIVYPHHLQITPDLPDPDEVKKYRAYLTRLSKWTAVKLADDKTSMVRDSVVRAKLIKGGELGIYLDEAWAKRVFADKTLFEDIGDGFRKVLMAADEEEAPAHPSRWEGVRPGEDVIGFALQKMIEALSRVSPKPNLRSRWLDSDDWQPVHQLAIQAMEYAKRRGVEKPLVPTQERSFREACIDEDEGTQAAGLWFLNTRTLVEAHGRFLAFLKEGTPVQSDDLSIIRDVMRNPEDNTPEIAMKFARRHLLERGILHGKKP